MVQPDGANAPPEFVNVIFERDDQDAAALKDMLAGELSSGRERHELCVAQRRLSNAAIREERAHEAPTEDVAEQPAAGLDLLGVVAGVPLAELSVGSASPVCLTILLRMLPVRVVGKIVWLPRRRFFRTIAVPFDPVCGVLG